MVAVPSPRTFKWREYASWANGRTVGRRGGELYKYANLQDWSGTGLGLARPRCCIQPHVSGGDQCRLDFRCRPNRSEQSPAAAPVLAEPGYKLVWSFEKRGQFYARPAPEESHRPGRTGRLSHLCNQHCVIRTRPSNHPTSCGGQTFDCATQLADNISSGFGSPSSDFSGPASTVGVPSRRSFKWTNTPVGRRDATCGVVGDVGLRTGAKKCWAQATSGN